MTRRIPAHAFLTMALTLVAIPAPGQELTLFRDDGTVQITQGDPVAAAGQAPVSLPVLKGIYRFGDTYHITLENAEGGIHKATWRKDQAGTAPTVNGYELQDVEGTRVLLGMPAGTSCRQGTLVGGNCIGQNQVAVSFVQTRPASSDRTSRRSRSNDNDRRRSSRDNDEDGRRQDFARQVIEAAREGDERAIAIVQSERGREFLQDQLGGRGGRGGGRGGN